MSEAYEVRLDAPDSNLDHLSFADANPGAISDWVSGLPLANTHETASQLKGATAELALLDAPGVVKMESLEAVRPVVHYICSRLDRNTNPTQATASASDLLLNLCTGYKSIVLSTLPAVGDKSVPRDILPKAMHRLLSDLSRVLLRALQTYSHPPQNFWWELNEIYRLAETLDLTEFKCTDDENSSVRTNTISTVYIRSLLLASCKSNQLQQHHIKAVFGALEHWGSHVMLDRETHDALLVVDLLANKGPQYAQFAPKLAEPRALRTEVLTYDIEAYLKEISTNIVVPEALSNGLLSHLVEAWSVLKPRTFKRMQGDSALRVCVGLRAAHYFLSGGIDFAEQLSSTEALLRREVNPFLDVDYEAATPAESDDPWSQAHDLKIRIPENPNIETPEKILLEANTPNLDKPTEHYETQVADTSPAGYRLEWSDQAPPKIIVGEIVALREEKDTRWCVAAVRWIQSKNGTLGMGVELLAPRAIPVALRIIQKKGGPTDYTRGLLLPEIKAIKQPATLITPKVPFAPGQKLNVQRQGLHATAQLLESTQNTESFNQFTFRMLDGYLEN